MTEPRRALELDPTLHNRARIAIVSRLVAAGPLRFAALRDSTGLTSGNLASHLKALEETGYLAQRDALIGLRPGKMVSLTKPGEEAFWMYVNALEALLVQLRAAGTTTPA